MRLRTLRLQALKLGVRITLELTQRASCLPIRMSSSSSVSLICTPSSSLLVVGVRVGSRSWVLLCASFPRDSLNCFPQYALFSTRFSLLEQGLRSLAGSRVCRWMGQASAGSSSLSALVRVLASRGRGSLSLALLLPPFFCSSRVWFLRLSRGWPALATLLQTFLRRHWPQNCSSMSSTMRFCLVLMPACSLRKRSSLAWRSAISRRQRLASESRVQGLRFQMSRMEMRMLRPRLWKVERLQVGRSRVQQALSLSSRGSAVKLKMSNSLLPMPYLLHSLVSRSARYLLSLSSSNCLSLASYIFSPRSFSRYLTRYLTARLFSPSSALSQVFKWQPHSSVQECTIPNSLYSTTLPQPSFVTSSFLSLAFMCFREKMHCSNSKFMQFWLRIFGNSWLSTCSTNSQIALPKAKFPLQAGCACRSRYMNSLRSFWQCSHNLRTAKQEGCLCSSGVLQQRFRFWLRASMRQCPRATPSGLSMGTSTNTKYLRRRCARMSFLSSRNSRMPLRVKLEGVSMGCTLADTKIMGLLLRKRGSFWSLWSNLQLSWPSLPSCEDTMTMSMSLPSQLLASRQVLTSRSASWRYCCANFWRSDLHCSQEQGQVKANCTISPSAKGQSNRRTISSSLFMASPRTGCGRRLHSPHSPSRVRLRQTGRQ